MENASALRDAQLIKKEKIYRRNQREWVEEQKLTNSVKRNTLLQISNNKEVIEVEYSAEKIVIVQW